MDKVDTAPKKTFRTICRAPRVCLLGCVLLSVGVCTGNSSYSSPYLITYRPELVDRSTDGGVFVLSGKLCKSATKINIGCFN